MSTSSWKDPSCLEDQTPGIKEFVKSQPPSPPKEYDPQQRAITELLANEMNGHGVCHQTGGDRIDLFIETNGPTDGNFYSIGLSGERIVEDHFSDVEPYQPQKVRFI